MKYIYVASTYNCGAYGAGTYNGSASCGASTSSGSGSVLTNTGFDIALIATIACLIVFVSLLVRFWKKPRRSAQQRPVVGGIDKPGQGQAS